MCNFCDEQCSCHINPPCNFCITHIECSMCRQPVCKENIHSIKVDDTGDTFSICPDCADEIRYGKVIGVSVNGTGIS